MDTELLKEKSKKSLQKYNALKYTFTTRDNYIKIHTYYLDMSDHEIVLFLKETQKGYHLSDNCYVFGEFFIYDFSIFDSGKNASHFYSALKTYHISFNENDQELFVDFPSIDDFPQALDQLIQCIQRLSAFPFLYKK